PLLEAAPRATRAFGEDASMLERASLAADAMP
ncbi:IclR family transcriptional regulator, partial [Mesorhizobium sp. M7A.F.Ca.CA.004.01.1.1]